MEVFGLAVSFDVAIFGASTFPNLLSPLPAVAWLLLPLLSSLPLVVNRVYWTEDDKFLVGFLESELRPRQPWRYTAEALGH
jgi:hypothetical protein